MKNFYVKNDCSMEFTFLTILLQLKKKNKKIQVMQTERYFNSTRLTSVELITSHVVSTVDFQIAIAIKLWHCVLKTSFGGNFCLVMKSAHTPNFHRQNENSCMCDQIIELSIKDFKTCCILAIGSL